MLHRSRVVQGSLCFSKGMLHMLTSARVLLICVSVINSILGTSSHARR